MIRLPAGLMLMLPAAASLAACLDFRSTIPGEVDAARSLLEPTEACVVRGGELQLTAAIVDVNRQPYPRAKVSWTTSDSQVVDVSPEGLVIARRPGSAVITASVPGWSGHSSVRVSEGLVSFVIDDGHSTDWTAKRPLFEAKGAVASVAIITHFRQLGDSELRSLVREGWEILAHS